RRHTIHSSRHLTNKLHHCPTCLKPFRSKQQLSQHDLVHNGIRRHQCSYCDKCFKQLSHLQQHVRIHTGKIFIYLMCVRVCV
ncbi:hypothetical protein LOTGIDRAFT_116733, partial [Lottia gigantea]